MSTWITLLRALKSDMLLCETMSSASEALAATTAACETGLPTWVAWSLHDNKLGVLRSEESLEEAYAVIEHLPVTGFLVNCCPPESIEAAMPFLSKLPGEVCGGYANTFMPIPAEWTLDGDKEDDGLLDVRDDLDAVAYANHACRWVEAGANLVGGCCGTSPAYIETLKQRLG